MLNNNKYFSALKGQADQMNALYDQVFSNTPAITTSANAFSFGKGETGGTHTHLSVMSFNSALGSPLSGVRTSSHQQSLVTTVSKTFSISSHGTVETEVSRSIAGYRRGGQVGGENKTLERLFSSGDLINNTAFLLKYHDEFPNAGLSYGVRFNKTANGYNNPGNAFLNAGSTEGGFSFRKNLWKKKALLYVRSDVKQYQYNDKVEDKWRNLYSVIDFKWRLNRGQSISLRYLPSQMVRLGNGTKERMNSFNQLSADVNLSRKFGRYFYSLFPAWLHKKIPMRLITRYMEILLLF